MPIPSGSRSACRRCARWRGRFRKSARSPSGFPAPIAARLANCEVAVVACDSQIGSGALPTQRIASMAIAIRPLGKRGAGAALNRLAASFRALPIPVIGRVHDGAFVLDLRCLEDEASFAGQLAALAPP